MKKRTHAPEEIIRKLRQGEVLLGQGKLIAEMFAAICAYRRRRTASGASRMGAHEHESGEEAARLEAENVRLRRAVADLALDKQILQGEPRGKFAGAERRRRCVLNAQ